MKKVWELTKRIMSGLITVILLLVLLSSVYQRMSGELPGVFGIHMMYVMTGSMEPEIMTGNSVFVRECSAERLKIGDVICFRGTEGEMAGRMITHKVVIAPYEENGELWLQTQGVANATPDKPIRGDQVYGIVIGKSAVLGKLFSFFCTVPGLLTITAPIIWFMIDEIRHMIASAKDETKEDISAADDTDKEKKQ